MDQVTVGRPLGIRHGDTNPVKGFQEYCFPVTVLAGVPVRRDFRALQILSSGPVGVSRHLRRRYRPNSLLNTAVETSCLDKYV